VQIQEYEDLQYPNLTIHAFYLKYLLPIFFDVQSIEHTLIVSAPTPGSDEWRALVDEPVISPISASSIRTPLVARGTLAIQPSRSACRRRQRPSRRAHRVHGMPGRVSHGRPRSSMAAVARPSGVAGEAHAARADRGIVGHTGPPAREPRRDLDAHVEAGAACSAG